MSNITASKKNRKAKSKLSPFEKLWQKAEKLQRQNSQLRARLDGLIQSSQQQIQDAEKELAKAEMPLLTKLLTLGQRKSLAKWERQVLDEWIRELTGKVQSLGLTDSNLMDDLARYDAFRMGIELEEASQDTDGTATPYEQMSSYMENLRQEAADAAEKEQAEVEDLFTDIQQSIEDMVEKRIDEIVGPPPNQPKKHGQTYDLLQDELDAELERQTAEYQKKRETVRAELMAELDDGLRDEFGSSPFDDIFDDSEFDFNFGDEPEDAPANPAAPKIDNSTFQKMFRATAARLHPDRESDPAKRLEKQKLMAELLKARKKGDLLTVLLMYQQYTDNTESFSSADEKQLIDALNHHIDQLESEKEEIIFQSPMHHMMYECFYHSSKKKQEKAIENHIKSMQKDVTAAKKMAAEIKSLKSLKPRLDERYEWMQITHMSNFMDDLDLRPF